MNNNTKKLEQEKQRFMESERKHRTFLSRSIDGFFIVNPKGEILDANESFCKLVGYSHQELRGMTITDIEAVESSEETAAHISQVIKVGHDRFESRHIRKTGEIIDVEISVNFEASIGDTLFAFVRDISERKQAEAALLASEERYRSITETSMDAIAQLDRCGKIIFMNPAGVQMFGYDQTELLNMRFISLVKEAEKQNTKIFFQHAAAGQKVKADFYILHKQGHEVPVNIALTPLAKQGEIIGFTFIGRDITDKHRQEEERLRKSLTEKESLLKEIHHRVKNNMQIVSSLLFLQAQKVENPEFKALIKDSRNRVRTMGLIHELLYKTENLSLIDFKDYIRTLTGYLTESNSPSAKHVTFSIDVDNIYLHIDIAIPCGLIITEVVTNSLKYAFTKRRHGKIEIEMIRNASGREITLRISDNGVGLPIGFDMNKTDTLGMNLIKSLSEQLDAHLELKSEQGTRFTFMFPLK